MQSHLNGIMIMVHLWKWNKFRANEKADNDDQVAGPSTTAAKLPRKRSCRSLGKWDSVRSSPFGEYDERRL